MNDGGLFTLAPEPGKGLFPVDGLNTAALDVIVAGIQRLAHLGQLCQISGHRVLDKLVSRPAGFFGKLVKAGFGFRLETHFHACECRGISFFCQRNWRSR